MASSSIHGSGKRRIHGGRRKTALNACVRFLSSSSMSLRFLQQKQPRTRGLIMPRSIRTGPLFIRNFSVPQFRTLISPSSPFIVRLVADPLLPSKRLYKNFTTTAQSLRPSQFN